MNREHQIVQKDNTYDRWIFILGISYMSLGTFIDMLSTAVIGQNPFDTLLYLGALGLLILLSLKKKAFRVKTNIFFVPLVFSAFFIIDLIMPEALPNKRAIMLSNFLEQGILGYFFARSLSSYEEIHKALKYVAMISFVSAAGILLFPARITRLYDNGGDYGSYMLFGFRMIIAAILFQYFAFTEKTRFYRLFAIASFLLLAVFANRGAVVTAAAFFVLYNLMFVTGKKRFALIFAVVLLVLAYYYIMSSGLISSIYFWLTKKGINSRNLLLLINAQSGESGRNHIYEAAMMAIKKHIFFGTGLSGSWRFSNAGYPHNIVLELCVQFGLIPAALMIGGYLIGSLKIMLNRSFPSAGMLYLVSFTAGVIPLFFSASYVNYWFFWVMLAMYQNCKDMIKMEKSANA